MLSFNYLWGLFSPPVLYFLLAASLALLFQVIYNRFFHPLANIPGPFWASLTRIWWLLVAAGGNQHEVHVAIHKKYGILRLIFNLMKLSLIDYKDLSSESLQISSHSTTPNMCSNSTNGIAPTDFESLQLDLMSVPWYLLGR
jgi:hypothetical protein